MGFIKWDARGLDYGSYGPCLAYVLASRRHGAFGLGEWDAVKAV